MLDVAGSGTLRFMSIALLKTFIAVSDHGSFVAAAQALGVTQAAIGQQMKRLETELGASLFDRTGTPARLNAHGMSLLPRVRELLDAYDSLSRQWPDDGNLQGEIALGAVPSTIRGLVPLAAKVLMADRPQLRIRVVPGLTQDLVEQVERGALDAAVLSEPGRVARTLHWVPCVEERLVLLTEADELDSDVRQLLQARPYIRHTRRAAVGELADAWLSSNDIVVNTAMEMESLESVASMVFHGLGVSIAPDLSVPDPVFSALRKLPLDPPAAPRVLGLISRHDSPAARLVATLSDVLQSVIDADG